MDSRVQPHEGHRMQARHLPAKTSALKTGTAYTYGQTTIAYSTSFTWNAPWPMQELPRKILARRYNIAYIHYSAHSVLHALILWKNPALTLQCEKSASTGYLHLYRVIFRDENMERRKFLSKAGAGAAIGGLSALPQSTLAKDTPASSSSGKSNTPTVVNIESGAKSARIRIRPAARGGKYLGHDAADGNNLSALVALQNRQTSKIVAYGFTKAPTPESAGPADLMKPVSRSKPFASDTNTVDIQLSVPVTEPADFRVLVFGPLKHVDQACLVQSDITVLPGVDIGTAPDTPQGLVIEIPGLCISNVVADLQGSQLSCTAEVTMMCGCPIHNQPEWFWPDNDFSIQLVTYMHSGAQHFYPMAYDKTPGTVSTFTGTWRNQASEGDRIRQVWVYAIEPKLGNQGKFRIFPAQPKVVKIPAEVREIFKKMEKNYPPKNPAKPGTSA